MPDSIPGMTLEQARARCRARPSALPPFWFGSPEALAEALGRVRVGRITEIARSPGGRPLHLVSYGEPTPPARRANFNSAIGGREPAAYCDRAARPRPVLLFIGPVHAQETEGLTGLMNFVHLLETGRDCRGREHPRLLRLARECRVLIVPEANPDGLARFEPGCLQGLTTDDVRFWGQGTWRDHTFCGWPECKRRHPMPRHETAFLGCYYNDAGINPMHDEFFDPMSSEAPALLRLARETAPDLAVSLHSHQHPPTLLRPAYLPLDVQTAVRRLAENYAAALEAHGLPTGRLFKPQAEEGPVPAPFNLVSALYHISGAAAFTFECPHGLRNEGACHVDCDTILDLQLLLYETMLAWALEV